MAADRERRARYIGEWLKTESRYLRLTGSSLHAVRCRNVSSRPHLCVSRLCRCPLDAARLAGGRMVVRQLFPAAMRAALGLGMTARRFPPPWSVDEQQACFIVRDANGQALA